MDECDEIKKLTRLLGILAIFQNFFSIGFDRTYAILAMW